MKQLSLSEQEPWPPQKPTPALTMMTIASAPQADDAPVRETLGKDGLMRFVLDAVELVDWPHKNEGFGLSQGPVYPSALLMILEVYCYARGLYNSNEVAALAHQNAELKVLFHNGFPDEQVLKRFRRDHHLPIKECLLKIFDLAFRVRFGDPDKEEAPVDFCVVQAMDKWFEPICGPQPEAEAINRIDQAIFGDQVLGTC